MNKTRQNSNWEQRPLSQKQVCCYCSFHFPIPQNIIQWFGNKSKSFIETFQLVEDPQPLQVSCIFFLCLHYCALLIMSDLLLMYIVYMVSGIEYSNISISSYYNVMKHDRYSLKKVLRSYLTDNKEFCLNIKSN